MGHINRTDDGSFEVFAAASIPRLRRIAYAWCLDSHRADDLVQGALERVFAAWWRVRSDGEPFAYARTTMMRLMLSEQRRPWRRHEAVGREPRDGDGQAVQASEGTRLDLLAALAALPPRQRAVVVLRHIEELSVGEVADILNCSEGTVKSQAHHARRALRHLLDPDLDSGPGRSSAAAARPVRPAPRPADRPTRVLAPSHTVAPLKTGDRR